MAYQFPPSGNFEEVPLHELLLKLARGRFSGSIEIKANKANRVFHYDNGNLCAATSDSSEEGLEHILDQTFVPTLKPSQKEEVESRLKDGGTLSSALVDLGILNANGLLSYNRNLAEWILKGALSDTPTEFRIMESEPGQYNPVPFDPMEVIRDSIVDDLDGEIVRRRLGDEDMIYIATEDSRRTDSPEKRNPEIKLLISRLDGDQSLSSVAGNVGLNADRSLRLLYYLKLRGWIAPSGAEITGAAEEGRSVISGLSATAATAYQQDDLGEEDASDILRLLENDQYEESTQEEPRKQPFHHSLDAELAKKRAGKKPAQNDKSGSLVKRIFDKALRIVKPYYLPIGIGIIATVVIFALVTSQVGDQPPGEISFYKDTDDTSQAPLPPSFTIANSGTSARTYPVTRKFEFDDNQASENKDGQPKKVEKKEPVKREPSKKRNVDFDSIQDRALNLFLEKRWSQASALWRDALTSKPGNTYTLLVNEVPAAKAERMEWVFEPISNSKSLRRRFFILRSGGGSESRYLVCWGFFQNPSSAQAELQLLPESIRTSYKATPRKLSSLLEAQ